MEQKENTGTIPIELSSNKMVRTINITYGINERMTKNVTRFVLDYLNKYKSITTDRNINAIIGFDPYPGKFKKLFIYQNDYPTIIINEHSEYLDSPIYLNDNGLITKNQITTTQINPINQINPVDQFNRIDQMNLINPINQINPINPINKINQAKCNLNILIYLIYHDDRSYEVIEKYKDLPYVKLYFNETTKYFESRIFRYLLENKNEWIGKDYVGILTYSFERKIRTNLEILFTRLTETIITNNSDLIIFYNTNIPNVSVGSIVHPKQNEIFNHVLPKFDYNLPINYRNIPAFFCNYFVTKTKWMEKYVEFAIKFMEYLDDSSDIYLQNLLNSNSCYIGKVKKEKLLEITGFPYYTHHPFIMERLPCIFFWNQSIKPIKV